MITQLSSFSLFSFKKKNHFTLIFCFIPFSIFILNQLSYKFVYIQFTCIIIHTNKHSRRINTNPPIISIYNHIKSAKEEEEGNVKCPPEACTQFRNPTSTNDNTPRVMSGDTIYQPTDQQQITLSLRPNGSGTAHGLYHYISSINYPTHAHAHAHALTPSPHKNLSLFSSLSLKTPSLISSLLLSSHLPLLLVSFICRFSGKQLVSRENWKYVHFR